MKRILIALLIVVMIFSIIGCAKTDQVEETTDTADTASDAASEDTADVETGDAVADAATAYFADIEGNNIFAWTDLFAKIEAGDEPFVLSIRQDDVYTAGHIEGAYLASWGADLASKVSMLPTDETVYVYCYSGQTAGQTVALLRMLGIEAYSVKSGYNYGAMKTEGYEDFVQTSANELPDAGAEFDADVLAAVEDYFNAVADNANFKIGHDDAAAAIESGDAFVLDIRTAEDFDMGHIEGTTNMPFGNGMQENFADVLPMDEKIIVACYSGQTAGQATAILRMLGYDAVSMHFGMKLGWAPYVSKKAATNYFADYPGARIVTWEDLFAKIDANEDIFILDIRQDADYEAGHITSAFHASWAAGLSEKVAMLPTDQTVYVYCVSGQTAGQTVALLNMLGIDAVSVKSGFKLGAMAFDGYEAYVNTTAIDLPDMGEEFDPFVLATIKGYFDAVAEGGSNIIASADAQPLIEAGDVFVLDVRKAEDFAAGHIEGAINIPFGENMQDSFADALPMDKQIIVTCYSGQTAGQTVAVLRVLGYDAISLKSGMTFGWTEGEFPVVTE